LLVSVRSRVALKLTTVYEGDIAVDLCPQPLDIRYASKLFFALSPSGKLVFASLQSPYPQPIASSVTSFTLTEDFLIYTTSAQSSHYAPIPTLERMCNGEEVQSWETEWETRRIERGALAVVACPSSMSLVLQMPRGNLETVYPRPLVLAVVRKDVLRFVVFLEALDIADLQRSLPRCVDHLP
jgi:elongator complex protein 1